MKSSTVGRMIAVILSLAFSSTFGACARSDPEPIGAVRTTTAQAPAESVEIVEVIDDVAYYPGCENEPVDVAGTTWYPVSEWGNERTAALFAEITSVPRREPSVVRGYAPRIPEPGPGDDIGTLVVYADGIARYETESGRVQWLTTQTLTYDWAC